MTPLRAYEEAEARLEFEARSHTSYQEIVGMFAVQRSMAVLHRRRARFWRGLAVASWIAFAVGLAVARLLR